MIATVIYQDDDEQKIKTFETETDAKEWINEQVEINNNFGSAQILVDYSQVQIFKEKYDEYHKLLTDNLLIKTTNLTLKSSV